jgi:hypothetical protein
MLLRIWVSGSALADELRAYLVALGADARREGETIVVRPREAPLPGEPANQNRVELEFVVRAWAYTRPGIAYEIVEAA